MQTFEQSCCFTGYRPEKFKFRFSEHDPLYVQLVSRLLGGITKKIELGCRTFYTGMARGFDILAAEQVAALKLRRKDLKLIAVIPFKGMELSFSPEWQYRFNKVLEECDEVIILNDHYEKWVYAQRNEYMVDRSRHVICYFDGSKGGTANTVRYATSLGRDITNICEENPLKNDLREYKAYFRLIPPDEE